MKKVTVVGLGPGDIKYLSIAAKEVIENADYIVVSKRYKNLFNKKNTFFMGNIKETLDLIDSLALKGAVAVLVSGDPLLHSLFNTIKNNLKDIEIDIVPGISSMQLLGARIGETIEDVKIVSAHGLEVTSGSLAMAVSENKKTFVLCSSVNNPSWICNSLLSYGINHVKICVGSRLSYEDELINIGFPNEIVEKNYDSLTAVMIINNNPQKVLMQGFLSDKDFIRDDTPMTKENVRLIAIHKLKLSQDNIVWDIGAGTGSIAVEVARQCHFGQVHAIEMKKKALELIYKNREKFNLEANLIIHEGRAIDVIKDLPIPDVVFIGGANGEIEAIIDILRSFKKSIRIVISAVTIETLSLASSLLVKEDFSDFEVTQVSISESRKLGKYTLMEANNPVHLISATLNSV
ncbi:bifunctional cobalt-precorrin-7 (C(5))-methyltransferase/cobalt-precorrin-6B (C(15))-methyltransferase [Clostridium cellulovorans]|uniref:Precorrin-6y C5,15-methyltransferase (Decarboxylating), CbiE subunit n=1 Tax=Clostridium cellulovorans (strain ATCC 35296 / DSM 3052 / OCM 3 / 743B) TaxID=573061 RepID=D9SP04_CLOC7|nr:bifunctional cobalt-precorrin-7 (C(5))-methyltransferase/cobalt-precorrin-6B (C(15))-methyltransferase [Clostridium cellulovorans]ADL51969.1 precorrin-6y C5,15-methyltransferase (decarboxylating), CbiE subunit [Clostridium cellulovorans 743B]